MSKDKSSFGFGMGLIAGVIGGIVAGVLYAPHPRATKMRAIKCGMLNLCAIELARSSAFIAYTPQKVQSKEFGAQR